MEQPTTDIKTKKASKKKRSKLDRTILNIVRTAMRNNMDLKSIADNKANILMSLNALMITFLLPIVIANRGIIVETLFIIPLAILSITCVITVIYSAAVLRPFSARGRVMKKMSAQREKSPFFFENYEKMEVQEYYDYFCQVSDDEDAFHMYVVEELHYYGKILSIKYDQIKNAYSVFMGGIILTTISLLTVVLFN